MEKIKTTNLLDLDKTIAKELFEYYDYPYQILQEIKNYLLYLIEIIDKDEYEEAYSNVWVARNAKIHNLASIEGPAIIDSNTEVRPGAYIRGNVIIGSNSVIGNSTEIKNSILFDNVQVPHYNYIGDSVLGYRAHMGAGSILSNFKATKNTVNIKIGHHVINTGLKKFGAILGDNAEIGCGAVLNPGTIVGRNAIIYPLTSVRGYVPEGTILKLDQKQEIVKKLAKVNYRR